MECLTIKLILGWKFQQRNSNIKGTIAQWLEQVTHNHLVEGSNPSRSTYITH